MSGDKKKSRKTTRKKSAAKTRTKQKSTAQKKIRKKTSTRRKKRSSRKNPRKLGGLLKGLIGLALIFAIVMAIGGIYMRGKVITMIRSRVLSSAAVIYSSPLAISLGMKFDGLKIYKRLKRLGYVEVAKSPTRAGEFSRHPGILKIFLRRFQLPNGKLQTSKLVELFVDNSRLLTKILDAKYKHSLKHIYLEPEALSALGSSDFRAVEAKRLTQYPKHLVDAIIAIEDERFYSHFGVDPRAIVRALYQNYRQGKVVQGGSTLTQQLTKNLFYSSEKSIKRKILEAISAILVETSFSKDRILEMYMNEIFMGQEGKVAIHGFGEAAKSFFGKDVSQLSLAQSATLAGIIKAPSTLSPRRYPDAAKKRRKIVLDRMLDQGMISRKEYKKAVNTNTPVVDVHHLSRIAPYYVDYLSKQIRKRFSHLPLEKSNIHTGIDVEFQLCAQRAIKKGLRRLESTHARLRKGRNLQASLIAMDISSGQIKAWVGGRNYADNQFDRISLSKRQPGSLFKPFVYLTVLDGALNDYRVAKTTSLLDDEPLRIRIPGDKDWEPRNYGNRYRGVVTVREALTHSINISTINIARKVGLDYIARTAERLGLASNLPRVPSIVLGSSEVSPLQLIRAYGTIANGGILMEPLTLVSVTMNGHHQPLYYSQQNRLRVASPQAVYVLTDIMKSVIREGTGRRVLNAGFTRPAAGKTGTTNDFRDAWFAGFTPKLLAIVWIGFDDNKKVGVTGGVAAAPIWADFMNCSVGQRKVRDFAIPDGVVLRNVDLHTGLLYEPGCPDKRVRMEVFVKGTEPVASCLSYYRYGDIEEEFEIDQELLALPKSRHLISPGEELDKRKRNLGEEIGSLWDSLFGEAE